MEKLALEPLVKASATPLLGMLPLTQPCTSAVMSISKNWFRLELAIDTPLPPVADAPSAGGGVLKVSVFSFQPALSW